MSKTHTPSMNHAEELRRSLGVKARPKFFGRWPLYLFLAALFPGGWLAYGAITPKTEPPTYKTQAVKKGDITTSVGATGTVEPISRVDVGAEISGRVVSVEVDWNERVEKDQILVRLDTEPLKAQLEQAQAQLQSAKASAYQAQAAFDEAQQAEARAQMLADKGMYSKAQAEAAVATLARSRAQVRSAHAQRTLAEARVRQVETDLKKAVIRSPISGMVLMRAVEPGNAVSASLQTPVLFTIVKDLSEMELHLSVDEADVAKVNKGMAATFTVDAYPQQTFSAEVSSVRLAPRVEQNVVTYEAVLSVDNRDQRLRPGMTATGSIIVSASDDVLRVFNAALRFTPARATAEAQPARTPSATELLGGRMGRRDRSGNRNNRTPRARGETQESRARSRVFVLSGGEPKPIRVVTGATDGAFTEITRGDLFEGDLVIIGVEGSPS